MLIILCVFLNGYQAMAISFHNALGMRESALTIRAERAGVLASNLANADTPGYKAKDIDFAQALKNKMASGGHSGMRMTDHQHMNLRGGNSVGSKGSSEQMYRMSSQPSIDGNSVEEQVEHAEFMKNSLEFQTAFTLLNSSFAGLRKAIKGE